MELGVTQEIAFPAPRVWALLSDFSDMPWNKPYSSRVVASGEGVGMLRRVFLPYKDEPLLERLELLDHDGMHMHYSILSGIAVPMGDFLVKVHLKPLTSERCAVELTLSFEPPEDMDLKQMGYLLEDSYREALLRLEAYLKAEAR